MSDKCLNPKCGKKLVHVQGRRKKKFCNSTCKSAVWYAANKDKKSGEEKIKKERATVVVPEKNIRKQPITSSETVMEVPPMPTRNKNEDALEFAARKNEWKRLYGNLKK